VRTHRVTRDQAPPRMLCSGGPPGARHLERRAEPSQHPAPSTQHSAPSTQHPAPSTRAPAVSHASRRRRSAAVESHSRSLRPRRRRATPQGRDDTPVPGSRVPSPESRVPSPESLVPRPESRVPSPESRVLVSHAPRPACALSRGRTPHRRASPAPRVKAQRAPTRKEYCPGRAQPARRLIRQPRPNERLASRPSCSRCRCRPRSPSPARRSP